MQPDDDVFPPIDIPNRLSELVVVYDRHALFPRARFEVVTFQSPLEIFRRDGSSAGVGDSRRDLPVRSKGRESGQQAQRAKRNLTHDAYTLQ